MHTEGHTEGRPARAWSGRVHEASLWSLTPWRWRGSVAGLMGASVFFQRRSCPPASQPRGTGSQTRSKSLLSGLSDRWQAPTGGAGRRRGAISGRLPEQTLVTFVPSGADTQPGLLHGRVTPRPASPGKRGEGRILKQGRACREGGQQSRCSRRKQDRLSPMARLGWRPGAESPREHGGPQLRCNGRMRAPA